MENRIQKLKEHIHQADAVIIGAGAGLSTAAGFVYSGERFELRSNGKRAFVVVRRLVEKGL